MKLYMHPVSTTCRAVRLFCAENGVAIDVRLTLPKFVSPESLFALPLGKGTCSETRP